MMLYVGYVDPVVGVRHYEGHERLDDFAPLLLEYSSSSGNSFQFVVVHYLLIG
jgi:hypothetical protein